MKKHEESTKFYVGPKEEITENITEEKMPSVASAVLLIETDSVAIPICRYVLGAVETFLDAVPSAGFFQGAVLL
jgi:hypothetical protein